MLVLQARSGQWGQRGGGGAMTRTRRIILLIVLAFVIYAVVTSPNQAAGYVQTVFVWLANAIRSVFQFFNALLH
jgi:hypothetical protein